MLEEILVFVRVRRGFWRGHMCVRLGGVGFSVAQGLMERVDLYPRLFTAFAQGWPTSHV